MFVELKGRARVGNCSMHIRYVARDLERISQRHTEPDIDCYMVKRCGTYYSVEKYWNALKAAQQKKTAMQLAAKGAFRQSLLGIMAGLWTRTR